MAMAGQTDFARAQIYIEFHCEKDWFQLKKVQKNQNRLQQARIAKSSKKHVVSVILQGLKFILNFILKRLDFSPKSFNMAKIGSRKRKLQKAKTKSLFFARAQISVQFLVKSRKLENCQNRFPTSRGHGHAISGGRKRTNKWKVNKSGSASQMANTLLKDFGFADFPQWEHSPPKLQFRRNRKEIKRLSGPCCFDLSWGQTWEE